MYKLLADWLNILWIDQGFTVGGWDTWLDEWEGCCGMLRHNPGEVTNVSTIANRPKRSLQPQRKYEIWPLKDELYLRNDPISGETSHDEGKRAHFGSGFSRVWSNSKPFAQNRSRKNVSLGGNYRVSRRSLLWHYQTITEFGQYGVQFALQGP